MIDTPNRRPSFSLRTLFVVVTVAAIISAVALLQYRRANKLRRLSNEHLCLYGAHSNNVPCYLFDPRRDRQLKTIAYHKAMAEKCSRTIWQPWVAIESDPPKPPPATP